MENPPASELMTTVVPRLLDLRAEFEAQLRAVVRVEEQVNRTKAGNGAASAELAHVLGRELAEMFANNTNIREVLIALAADNGTPVPAIR
jgi:hypothetical protein